MAEIDIQSLLPAVKLGDRVMLCGGEKGKIIDRSYNLGFPTFEITLESTGKVVTEPRYRFDIIPIPMIPGRVDLNDCSDRNNVGVGPTCMSNVRPRCETGTDHDRSNSEIVEGLGLLNNRPTISTVTTSATSLEDSDNDLLSVDIDTFILDEQNRNTQKKTESDMNKLTEFLRVNLKETRPINEIPPSDLCKLLCIFFMNIKSKDGKEFEPSTLRGISCSIDRYLKMKDYGFQISTSKEFQKVTEVIKSKQKKLKRGGRGNLENKADAISDEDVNKLYDTKQLGYQDPEALLRTMWFNNTIQFGMRGITEHHDMKWGDVVLCTDPDYQEYLQYNERQTKTRPGSNPRNVRPVPPRAWATPDNPSRCPVFAYKLYCDRRPSTYCKSDDPFYVSTNTNTQKSQKWFKSQPVGVNKLGKFMSTMAKKAGLMGSKCGTTGTAAAKRLTNHSARKYLVQKLNDSGVPPNQIMQISGHRNIQSINSYSSLNTSQQRAISNVISSHGQLRPSPTPGPCATTMSTSSSNVMVTDQGHGHPSIFNAPIYGGTFNITVKNCVPLPPKRPRVLYSDSDSN